MPCSAQTHHILLTLGRTEQVRLSLLGRLEDSRLPMGRVLGSHRTGTVSQRNILIPSLCAASSTRSWLCTCIPVMAMHDICPPRLLHFSFSIQDCAVVLSPVNCTGTALWRKCAIPSGVRSHTLCSRTNAINKPMYLC
jgi:hypothetical protein